MSGLSPWECDGLPPTNLGLRPYFRPHQVAPAVFLDETEPSFAALDMEEPYKRVPGESRLLWWRRAQGEGLWRSGRPGPAYGLASWWDRPWRPAPLDWGRNSGRAPANGAKYGGERGT